MVHLASGPKCHMCIMRGLWCGHSCKYGGWVLDAWPSGSLEISVNDLISSCSDFLLNLARIDLVIFN